MYVNTTGMMNLKISYGMLKQRGPVTVYHLTLHNAPEDTAVRTSDVTAVISLKSLKGLVQ
jgi:hypothetical protein